jgi:hypothetical protein
MKRTALAGAFATLTANVVFAALPIDLEIAADTAAPPGAMQEWGRELATMDLARLRLRGRGRADEPAVTITGEGANRRYHVLGLLNRRDELVLPGGRFGHGDLAALRKFLQELPERTEEASVERGMFGLTKPQFEQAFKELSVPVTSSTKGRSVAEAAAEFKSTLRSPLSIDATALEAVKSAPAVACELKGMTLGTSLAIVLRSAGLGFVPEGARDKPAAFRVVRIAPEAKMWPTGWKPEGLSSQVAPSLMQARMIEIENFALDKALEALAPVVGVPVILDPHVLAVEGIDPAKVQVKIARKKLLLRLAVDRLVGQAKLQGEIRVDEAGTVFYWATQFGPESARAGN